MSASGYDLCQIPAASPPAGEISNFVDPPTQENLPRIFTYITLPLMVIFLALRFYTRIVVTRNLGWDDYLCGLSAATIIVQIGTIFTILGRPDGPHMWNVPVCKMTTYYAKVGTLQGLLFPLSAMFIKTAILALYRRIFGLVKLANILILSGVAFTVVFYITMFIILASGCVPHPQDYATGGWLSTSYATRCQRFSSPQAATTGIVGAIIDAYILIFPLFFIWRLQTSTKRKVGVSSVFVVGSAATMFSVVGAVYRFRITVFSDQDITWTAMPIYAMNISEINIGIVCSCMPVIFVLFRGTLERSAIWLSDLIHLTKGWSRKASNKAQKGGSDGRINTYEEMHGSRQELPQVPKGTVTGLRSFAQKIGRTYSEKTQSRVSTDGIILTIVSEDYDYHQQLREGWPRTGQSAT